MKAHVPLQAVERVEGWGFVVNGFGVVVKDFWFGVEGSKVRRPFSALAESRTAPLCIASHDVAPTHGPSPVPMPTL